MNTKALFGGALMAAGMTANAQTFQYAANDTSGYYPSFGYSYAIGGAPDLSYDLGDLNTTSTGYSAEFGTTTVSTHMTATSFGSTGQWEGDGAYGYGYAGTTLQQFFSVSEDAELLIEWDYSGTDEFVTGFVLEDPSFGVVFDLANFGTSGSATVDVFAGTNYGAVMSLSSGFLPYFFTTEEQFINVTLVPAPGAVALLGTAGLVATRRRR